MSINLDIVFLAPEQISDEELNWINDFKKSFNSIFDQVRGDAEISIHEYSANLDLTNKVSLVFHFESNKWNLNDLTSIISGSRSCINITYDSDDVDDIDRISESSLLFSFGEFDVDNQNFFPKIVDVCYGILDQVEGLKIHSHDTEKAPVIFLADVRPEQEYLRDSLKRELVSHGYIVYPNKSVSKEASKLKEDLKKYLAETHLSIHIINENYDEENKSKVELENDFCKHYKLTENNSLERLVWSPPNEEFDERQLIFIERLKRHSKALDYAELIQTPLERFKNIIKNRVIKLMFERFIPEGYDSILESESNKVYVINNVEDEDNAKELIPYLKSKGLEVIPSFFDGDEVELLELHRFFLATCQGAIIYHSGRNRRWLQMKMLDLLKAPGYGRNTPIGVKGMYLKDNNVVLPKIENLNDLIVIRKEKFEMSDLNPIVEKI